MVAVRPQTKKAFFCEFTQNERQRHLSGKGAK
jgi:hypothetical protein